MFAEDTIPGKYQKIALAMNSFKFNKSITVKDIADKAGVHWNTTKKFLILLDSLTKIAPDFTIEEDNKIKVKKKPQAFQAVDVIIESPEMRALTKMMLKKATKKNRGVLKKDMKKDFSKIELDSLGSLIERGFVNSIEGKYYLSNNGIILANVCTRRILEHGISLPWEEDTKKKFDASIKTASGHEILLTFREVKNQYNKANKVYNRFLNPEQKMKKYPLYKQR